MLDTQVYKQGYREGGWKHIDSVAPKVATKQSVIPTETQPRTDVIYVQGKEFDTDSLWLGSYLPVTSQSAFDSTESFVIDKATGTYDFQTDYSGPAVNERTRDDEIQYESVTKEWDALDNWHDKEPNLTTHALDYWYSGPKSEAPISGTYKADHPNRIPRSLDDYITEQERSIYVEGNSAFIARKVLDEDLTRKYQAKLLNVFRDKRTSEIRIGSIRIERTNDTVHGVCVNYRCNEIRNLFLNEGTLSREDMEYFTYWCIAHGNNHAAAWFTSRPEFYELNPMLPTARETADENVNTVMFLFDHQRYCSDPHCHCSERLANLMPALGEVQLMEAV